MLLKEDNFNTYSQIEALKQGRIPVGGDCYHTIFHSIFKIEFQSLFITLTFAPKPKHFLSNILQYSDDAH